MKKYTTKIIITIIFIATIVALALGYSIAIIAGCILGLMCLVKANMLKDLKECEKAPKIFLITVWILYAMFLTAQVVISAWLWITYPIIMCILLLTGLGLYVYMLRKNNSEKAENA
jgi:hypothetical protein